MLQVHDLAVSFSGVRALAGASFGVDRGTVTALIGPNGAGKTTAFNCIGGVVRPAGGRIEFEGRDITAEAPSRRMAIGIARTFQHPALFGSLSVGDNIQVGTDAAVGAGRAPLASAELLTMFGLADVADAEPSSLPLGTRKRVEIARALAAAPSLLMLDEPANGLTLAEVLNLRDLLQEVKERSGITILLVEHHMQMVMSMSDHVVVLAAGAVIAQGAPQEIQSDPAVVAAYLGDAA